MATPNRSRYVVNTTKGQYEFETLEDLNTWRASRGLPPQKDESIPQHYRVKGDLGTVRTNSLEEAQAMADNKDLYNQAVIEQSLPIQVGREFPVLRPVKSQRKWASESLPVYLGQQTSGIDMLQGKNYNRRYNEIFYGAPAGSELFGDLRQKGVERAWESNPEYMHSMNEAGNLTGKITAAMVLPFALPAVGGGKVALTVPKILGATAVTGALLNEAGNGFGLWNTPAFQNRFESQAEIPDWWYLSAATAGETPTEESTTSSEASTASESSTPTPEPNNNDNKNDKRSTWKKLKDARDAYRGKGNQSQPTPQEPQGNWTKWIHATKNNAPTWNRWVRYGYNIGVSPKIRIPAYIGSLALDEATGWNTSDAVLKYYVPALAGEHLIKKLQSNKEKQDTISDNNSNDTSTDSITPVAPQVLQRDKQKTDSTWGVTNDYYSDFR